MDLFTITDSFLAELQLLRFGPPVSHVYNPLEYARAPYDQYLELYSRRPIEVVLLGMNPGPDETPYSFAYQRPYPTDNCQFPLNDGH